MVTHRLVTAVLSQSLRRSFNSNLIRLAGHNKWSKIQQKKGVNDSRKSVVFGKASKDIIVAIQAGGSTDPTKNLLLAAVLKRARELHVPKENIDKALAKASQGKQGGNIFIYEAIALESIGIIIECKTDNNTRTIRNLRTILSEYGGRIAPVKFMFERRGCVTVAFSDDSGVSKFEDQLESVVSQALDEGATDFNVNSTGQDNLPAIQLSCDASNIHNLSDSMQKLHPCWKIVDLEQRYIPIEANAHEPTTQGTREALRALVNELEANEDVVQVSTSISIA